MRGPSDRSAVNSRRSCCPTIPARAGESSSSAASEARWMAWRCGWCRREWTSPRLAVGVYATATSTPLFFAQAVGRFVAQSSSRRAGQRVPAHRPDPARPRRCARTPARPRARAPEARRRPVGRGGGDARARPTAPDGRPIWRASRRRWRRTLSSIMCCSTPAPTACRPSRPARTRPTTSACPGCWRPTRWRPCWPTGSAGSSPGRAVGRSGSGVSEEVSLFRALEGRRRELNSLVSQVARLRGVPHSHVHAGLRREAGGPPLATATTEQVEARIRLARQWLASA